MKSAKLRHNACIEDIDYRAARGLEKTVIRGPSKDSQWVQNHENLFVLGPTGVGKSFIACALAQKACATDTRRSTHGRRHCFVIWRWLVPTEAFAICLRG
jgi:DNA replication protein DnaC